MESFESQDIATASFVRFRETGAGADLERAFAGCAPALMRSAQRWCPRGAADLVQECFVVAIRRAADFDERRALAPWLLGILHNLARSRRWRARTAPGALDLELPEPVGREEDPAAVVAHNEWLEHLRDHVRRLGDPYQPVLLAYLEGAQPTEIARQLGRSPSTVRTQLERGLRQLRRQLPMPMLAVLCAIVATRSAHAGGAAPRWNRPRRSVLVGAAAVATALTLWFVATDWSVAPAQPLPPVSTAQLDAALASASAGVVASSPNPPPDRSPAAADRSEVRVRLRRNDGTFVAGVPVILDAGFVPGTSVNRLAANWRFATTGVDGEAVFADVPPGLNALRLHDLSVLNTFSADGGVQSYEFVVKPVAHMIVHVVDEAGAPVADAVAVVSGRGGIVAPGYPAARTDEAGVADVTSFRPDSYYWCTAPGFVVSQLYGPFGESGDTQRYETNVTLVRATRHCRGRVETPDGRACAGASVAVQLVGTGRPPVFTRTDADGTFDVEGLDGAWHASAVVPGWASCSANVGTDEGEAVLRLERGGTVEGRIVGIQASRVAHLRVQNLSHADPLNPFDTVASVVAADGGYRLRDVGPGTHTIGLSDGGASPVVTAQVTVTAGAVVHSDLLRATGWLVRVVDSSHQPLPDCVVRTRCPDELIGWSHTQAATSGADGLARLGAEDRTAQTMFIHLPRVVAPNELPALAIENATIGRELEVVVPDAARETVTVSGRVPPESCELLHRTGLELARPGGRRSTPVDADGRFVIEDVPPGSYRLLIRLQDGRFSWFVTIAEIDVTAGNHDVGMLPPIRVGTAVVSAAESAGAAPVHAVLRDAKGIIVEPLAMTPGTTFRRLLPVGRYACVHVASDASTITRWFDVAADATSEVVVDRGPGHATRIEVSALGFLADHAPLLATIRCVATGAVCQIGMPCESERRTWVNELALQPGVYELSARSAAGEETGGRFVVDPTGAQRTHAFRMP